MLTFLCSAFVINAQTVSVSGTITDPSGNPVPGVQIVISNSMLGAPMPVGWSITDNSGNYFWLDSIGGFAIGTVGTMDVSITDCDGTQITQSITFTPNQLSLTSNFAFCANGGGSGSSCALTLSPATINGNSVAMTANLVGGVTPNSYSWDMGDGTTYTTQNVYHTYQNAGTYNVCVLGADATGCIDTSCVTIIANGSGGGGNCTASFSYFPDSMNTLTQYFFANASGGTAPYTYSWDFGDGNTSTVQSPTHTYAVDSIYNVCVTITDANGCISVDCQPVIVFTTQNCYTYMTYTPDSTNSMVQYFSTQTIGTAPYTYVWDFGDGTTSTQNAPIHTYAQAGAYTVCVTVTDATGCTSTDCQYLFINTNTPCTTSFTASATAMNPLDYMFTSINANSPNILYLWDFGDGSMDSTSSVAYHTYSQAGTYNVCLTEFNMATGCVATSCNLITISGGSACQSNIAYSNMPGSLTVDFVGTASGGSAPYTYYWDFGDSSFSTVQAPTHTYNTIATGPVSYIVTLTITDNTGCTSTSVENVTVFPGNTSGSIIGYLWKDTLNMNQADGLVYLIEYDSISGSLTAIDTVQTQQGFFDFQNVAMGTYLVKAALLPTDPDYANYLPTYFIQSLNWSNAQYVGPVFWGLPALIDIQLVAGNNPGGAGFIGGLVVNGAGRPVVGGVTLIDDMDMMTAIPMEGVSVLLLDANGNAVTHTVTAADGSYSFSNIAMGTYNVHVEEVGKVTFDANVIVDANNSNHTDVHFTVHENMVTLTGAYAVSNVENFQVFPNPVQNTANIQIELKAAMDLTMTVTNLMGQSFINQNVTLNTGANTIPVEMSDLPTGLYLLSLKSGTDVITYKIQKM